MNPIGTQLIVKTVLHNKNKPDKNKVYSSFKSAKRFQVFKKLSISLIQDFALITIGVFSAAFGFKGFLLTNHLIALSVE